jgi:LPS sulfotransferase NodH
VRPIVVIAHARSGSNCLVELLNLALPAPILNEPFNERFPTWAAGNPDYLSRVHDVASLDAVVDEIARSWSGLKVLGYQLDLPLLTHLLLRADVQVIRLRRRNLLETVVSNLVALQTNLWKTWDTVGPLEDVYADLQPISLEDVRINLRYTRTRLDEVDAILDDREGPTLRLGYEELYLRDTEAALVTLWRFLDVMPPRDERVGYFLDPAQVQMARPETYGRVPNIGEIEAAFGDADVGHLTYL